MSKYCEEIVQKLEQAIETGLSNKKSCDLVGIDPVTFYDWIKNKPNFSNRIKKARSKKINELLEQIKAAGVGIKKEEIECPHCQKTFEYEIKIPQRAWQALSWILERTEFEDFGIKQRVEHTGEKGEPITIKEIIVKVDKNKTAS